MDIPASAGKFSREPFHTFGIAHATFSWDESRPSLAIKLNHYLIPGEIEISFRDVVFHCVMSESYIYMHEADGWQHHAPFIAQARTSQLVDHLAAYTLIEGMLPGLHALKHFRIIAQNFFLDVIAQDEPDIVVKNDA